MDTKSRWIGAVLLVAGTTTGAGMLALPVACGLAGFYPALLLFFLYWVVMSYTALLMLEVTLWMDDSSNLISMARHTLGFWGEAASWVSYLFLLYSLTTAYIAGSESVVRSVLLQAAGVELPLWSASLPLLAIFAFFICKGTRSVDYINRVLMVGLLAAFCLLLLLLVPHVEGASLGRMEWKNIVFGTSVAATSFGFHIIIPSLASYMKRDTSALVSSILVGGFIPLVAYIAWIFFTLSILPLGGEHGLVQGYFKGLNGAQLIAAATDSEAIIITSDFFAFFAIVTSFLGVSLSLFDFLSDGLKINKNGGGKGVLFLLTFVPPLVFTLTNPRAFLSALEYAGAFGVMFLLGLLPPIMVWRGRYHKNIESSFRVPGGKPALIAVMVISTAVIAIEVGDKLGWITYAQEVSQQLEVTGDKPR